MRIRHWQDYASLLVGTWLVLAGLVLGFGGAGAWITATFGIAVALFAIEGLLLPSYLHDRSHGAPG